MTSAAGIGHVNPNPDRRVLLVEDDAAVAQMYKLRLELDGHSVGVAPEQRRPDDARSL